MAETRIRKMRTPEDMLSESTGQAFNPPTFLYDAACCAQDLDHGHSQAFYNAPSEHYQHQARLRRLTQEQGSSNFSRVDGDFDYFGGVPDRLMNGK